MRDLTLGAGRHGVLVVLGVTAVLGVLAGITSVANTVPYVRDVLRGATRPHRGSWLIWALTAIVVYASQRADGASPATRA